MRRFGRRRADWLGDGLTALCGGALALNLLMVLGLLAVLAVNGLGHFWQKELLRVELHDGTLHLGEPWDRELAAERVTGRPDVMRLRLRTGNRDLGGEDFVWIDEPAIAAATRPAEAAVLERLEWGNFYGTPVELRNGATVLAHGPAEVRRALAPLHRAKLAARERLQRLERGEIGEINRRLEGLRLARRRSELGAASPAELAALDAATAAAEADYRAASDRLFALREELAAETLVVETVDGREQTIPVGQVVRVVWPNAIGTGDKLALYGSRLWEFVSAEPRESNTEGGIFPAIFGTVMMVFIMSVAVSPLGVLAALYLREYARQGPLVRMVRIAVNNLAGVPSIVFGVFGLGFFVYLVGGTIDRLFYPEALPAPTYGTGGILWASLTLALLTVPVVIVATEEGLAAVPRVVREGSLALGATKFETTWRVVLPAAAPGMLTGLILAMARAAGEVAPLMIVGMVKLAPALPVDGNFPFVHLERKFMHMGFHIYDVGFQSPNVEATKPLVFATALLLILVVTVMNLVAIAVRNHLRSRYATSAV
jgi:phosphate transport system permease protein